LNKITLCLCIFISCEVSFSQSDIIKINKDPKIDTLIRLKKEVQGSLSNLKIQIFSGKRDEAKELILTHIKNSYPGNDIELVYETPNYKVWVGNFFTQLQADKKLLLIKKKYPEAFIFRPKVKNNEVDLNTID
jgi:hypothetical protein